MDTADEMDTDSVLHKRVVDVQLYLDDGQLGECIVHILVSNAVGQAGSVGYPRLSWWSVVIMLDWWKGHIYPRGFQGLGNLGNQSGFSL